MVYTFTMLILMNIVLMITCSRSAADCFRVEFRSQGYFLIFAVLVNFACAIIALLYMATHV